MELAYLITLGRVLASRLPKLVEDENGRRRLKGDDGQTTLEWILIAGGVAAVAIAVVAIVGITIKNNAEKVGDPNFVGGAGGPTPSNPG